MLAKMREGPACTGGDSLREALTLCKEAYKREEFRQGILRYIRRWLLVLFRPTYVMRSLSFRRGECKKCGCCIVDRRCNYFVAPNFCSRFYHLPLMCALYPIDEGDKTPFAKEYCGFYWGTRKGAN